MFENIINILQNIILIYLSIEDIIYREISVIFMLLYFGLNIYKTKILSILMIILIIILQYIPQNEYIGNGDFAFIILYFLNNNSLIYLYIICCIFILFFQNSIPLIPIIYLSQIINNSI